jgi:hypothetical protein
MLPVGEGGWDLLAHRRPRRRSSGPSDAPALVYVRVTALRNSSQYVLFDLASRSAHSRVANLLPADQTTVDSLPQCLADEVSFHCVSLDQVKDRPQGSRKLEALRVLYVALVQISIVQ